MFSSLMPQRKEFFELLAAHSDRVVAGANATLRLMNGLGQGTEDIAVLVAEVNLNEQSARQDQGRTDHAAAPLVHHADQPRPDPHADHRTGHGAQRAAGRGQCGGHVQHQGLHGRGARDGRARRRRLHAPESRRDLAAATRIASRKRSTCAGRSTPSSRRPTACSARPSPPCSPTGSRSGRPSRCASSMRCRKRCSTVARTPPRRSKRS